MPDYSGNSQVEEKFAQKPPGLFGFFKDTATLSRELKSVWRVFSALAVGQILGAVLGYVPSPIFFVFLHLWWGGVQGGLVGYLLGLAWEFSDKERRNRLHLGVIAYMGFVSVLLFVMGLFIPWNYLTHLGSHFTQKP